MAAQAVALQANLHRAKDAEPCSPADFMPWIDKPIEDKKPVDIEKQQRDLAAAFGFSE